MGNKIRVLVALLVVAAIWFWAINSVVKRSYSGAGIAFPVGSGVVEIDNRGQEPIPVSMRSEGRTSNFRVESSDLNLRENSRRQGGARTAYHIIEFEVPPGKATLEVTRGSNVKFISASSQPIDAVVAPKTPQSARNTLLLATVVTLGLLFYVSQLFDHRWVGMLLEKMPPGLRNLRRKTA